MYIIITYIYSFEIVSTRSRKVSLNSIHPQANKQMKELLYGSPALLNDQMIAAADLLVKNSCLDKIWFGNSGAEVNEGAIKLARKYGAEHRTDPSKWSIPTCRETTSVRYSATFTARPMSIPISTI